MSVGTLAVYLPRMPAAARKNLKTALEALPRATSMREAALYRVAAIDWALEAFPRAHESGQLPTLLASLMARDDAQATLAAGGFAGVMRQVRESRELFHQLADALTLSPAEYDRQFQSRYGPRLEANCVAGALGIDFENARREEATAACRLDLLKAALDVVERGRAALPDHPDPYGDSAFQLAEFNGGFSLASRLVYNGQIIRLDFGLHKID
jgi:hypothetical protein